MCVATMKSMTYAMKTKRLLENAGIGAEIVNLDPSLTKRGCAYGVSFQKGREEEVKRLLRTRGIEYGRILGGEGKD